MFFSSYHSYRFAESCLCCRQIEVVVVVVVVSFVTLRRVNAAKGSREREQVFTFVVALPVCVFQDARASSAKMQLDVI